MAYKGYIGKAGIRYFKNLQENGSTINSIFNCFTDFPSKVILT